MYRQIWHIGVIIAAGLILHSCTTLQSSWRDFNAYFNTYYNAKTSFERGVELQYRQETEINPERPIRVHTTPRRAGQNEFQIAMQKSADVIRFHPRSRWVDNAIEMIGLSYFYQQQYFSADQKFLELLSTTTNPAMRQRAILWRGRAALELENYVEGINYLQSRLFSTEFNWDPVLAAEMNLVIAQLFIARGEYDDAEVYIAEALPDIRDRRMLMRTHFLHGQILEILGRYEESFEAFQRATHRTNPNYDLIYYAELKMGVVARKSGDVDWAYDHFVSMSRDDRHYDFIEEIEYEIARTLQDMSSYTRSRQQYERILRHRTYNPPREITAKIYYGLGEIHRDFYHDYTLAAAYFDSSAQQATTPDRLPVDFDASVLARSFGDYSRLQGEIHRLDSLLWLGTLSESEFDSVITQIRQQRIAEMEQQERERRRQQMISVDIDDMGGQADEESEGGFLNHQNPQLMQQMSQAFQAYWGARPLVDDWRRIEAVRTAIIRQYEEEGEEIDNVDQVIEEAAAPAMQVAEIDLSEIPFTREEQRETLRLIASHEYEIGNVFFTSLNLPDSAATYYRRVMNRFPDSDLAPQAVYSLSELYHSTGDSVHSLQYAMQLVDFYPNTIYAERAANRFSLDLPRSEHVMSRTDSLSQNFESIKDLGLSAGRARELRKFAENNPDADKAPEALYRAVLDYIQLAREDETYAYRMFDLSLTRSIWREMEEEWEMLRNTASELLADSAYMAVVGEYDAVMMRDDDEGLEPDEAEEETATDEGLELDEGDEEAAIDESLEPDEAEEEAATDEGLDPEAMEDEAGADVESDDAEEAALDVMGDSDPGDVEDTDPDETNESTVTGYLEAVPRDPVIPEAVEETPKSRKSIESILQDIAGHQPDEPDFSDLFPYEGALWDSARVALLIMRNEYPEFPRKSVVDALAKELDIDRMRAALVDTERIYPCNELDSRPEMKLDLADIFIESGFSQIIDEHEAGGSVPVVVLIDSEGIPVSVHTDEEYDDLGIMEALLSSIQQYMRFDAPAFTGVQVQAECEYLIEFQAGE
jgi:tetratricopeptide (TPR) repeat protein/TolA-binding protein